MEQIEYIFILRGSWGIPARSKVLSRDSTLQVSVLTFLDDELKSCTLSTLQHIFQDNSTKETCSGDSTSQVLWEAASPAKRRRAGWESGCRTSSLSEFPK